MHEIVRDFDCLSPVCCAPAVNFPYKLGLYGFEMCFDVGALHGEMPSCLGVFRRFAGCLDGHPFLYAQLYGFTECGRYASLDGGLRGGCAPLGRLYIASGCIHAADTVPGWRCGLCTRRWGAHIGALAMEGRTMGYWLSATMCGALAVYLGPRLIEAWREDRGAAVALLVALVGIPALLALIGS